MLQHCNKSIESSASLEEEIQWKKWNTFVQKNNMSLS